MHNQVNTRNERSDHHDVTWYPDLSWNDIPNKGYHDVRAEQNYGESNSHPYRVINRSAQRQGRTHPEHDPEYGILLPDTFRELLHLSHLL
jgi:hypothetical protein